MEKMLLLDIDGVMSPLNSIAYDEYIIVPNDYSTWTIPFTNYNVLMDVFESGNKVVWASAWEEVSNNINHSLKLPKFDYIKFTDTSSYDWFKFFNVKEFVENVDKNVEVLWVDDEIPEDVFDWIEQHENLSYIKPDSGEGLNEDERIKILEFFEI